MGKGGRFDQDCYQQVYDIKSKIFGQDHTQVKETLEPEALNEAKQNSESISTVFNKQT